MLPIKIDLPDGFLEEEVRCGYTVSREMKAVWAVELDLLAEFDRVCKKYGITYFASGGTMLGAVRHKGFIPWDDDIDLMMFRSEYDKLCEVATKEFEKPYFFQTEYTDHGSLRGHAQLRNSMTTGILKSELPWRYPFNQGIFMDIFPLDNVIPDQGLFEKQAKEALRFRKRYQRLAKLSVRYFDLPGNGPKAVLKRFAHSLCAPWIERKDLCRNAYRQFEATCQRYNHQDTEMISTLSFQFRNQQHFKYRSDYTEIIEVPFEFTMIPIGKEFDHALKTRYGNYMEFEVGTSIHSGVVLDAEKPYTEYLS